jgi:cobalt/nickel transport system permease protein
MQAQAPELTRKTFLHRLPARIKLPAILVLVLLTALLPRHVNTLYVYPALVVVTLWIAGRVPVWYGLRRLLFAEVFIVGIALLSLFSPAALPLFWSALLKSNICIAAMIFLTWTTPFHEMLQVLRALRVPSVMLSTLALMYRYIPVLAEESHRMQRARASRTFSRSRIFAWQSLSTIIAQLFLRTAARAERIYLAMCARGWK